MSPAITTWIFSRAAQSVRVARIGCAPPQLVVTGPGRNQHVHIGESEDHIGVVQLAIERQLHRQGWSYEGCVSQ